MLSKRRAYLPVAAVPLVVSILVSGCGGGGGGSQTPSTVTPIGGTLAPQRVYHPVPYNTSDPSNVGPARAQGITGAGVTVGVVDTDFNVSDPELGGRITKSVYTAPGTNSSGGFIGASGNGDQHGTAVAEALAGTNVGIAPGVQIQGVAAGTRTGELALNPDIYTYLFNKGVRIFNQSNGVGSISVPADSATYYNLYQPVVAKNGLVVWATGNGSNAQPTLTAGLPSLYPDLQKGWLAVTAVNTVGGTQAYSSADTVPGTSASYANKCGVAANWCLAAPGDFVSLSAGGRVYGTSFSTPMVTGAIAMVQQAYPWMNADLLRQTILSTATDMNDTATYGWGLLNASKAANGPALFTQSLALGPNVIVNFDTVSSTFSNAIGGDAGLVKDGTGALTLSGVNTYTGTNKIANGTLNITGSITSPVQIDVGGNLAGSGGLIANNVTSNGRLSNIGSGLTISGSYTAFANAVFANDINAIMTVGGTVNLGGSHLVATVPAGNPDAAVYVTAHAKGVPQKIITAGIAVVNTFSDVGFQTVGGAFPPLINAQVTYLPKEVDLTLSRGSMTAAVQSASARQSTLNSAANVEQAMTAMDAMVTKGQTGGTGAAMMASAAAVQWIPTAAALAVSLDSLSGQIHASAQALTFQQSQAVNRNLSNRLSQLGSQDKRITAGLWANVTGASGKLTDPDFAGATTSMAGGQFGVDTPLNDQAIVGAALSYADSQASFDHSGGNAKSNSVGVSLYGRYALSDRGAHSDDDAGGSYVSARTGFALITSKVTRTAYAGTEVENLNANHDDTMISAYVESGFAVAVSHAVTLLPFAGVSYDRLKRGGFIESGGSFGLMANSQAYHQIASALGVRAQANLDWFGGRSSLQAYAAWQHAFSNGNLDFTAAFTGAPGSTFSVQGIGLSRNSGWSGAGISTAINRQWSTFANFDGQFGRGGLRNNVVSVGFNLIFN
ncbi:autotransporter domain-containing protein [Glaciimonas immobilis]|uniref:Outer membrane autotransporter protein n=1 Tax=Glaciimonas immobilis TaxID=728004 RepID=A0A840RTM0_9BURK|nr:autotransporter domain-containing protein [Glaciimonas immobilis]KAF3996630.1 autotransporter domain-containing protein [Glaciimonas immobilis]MBB5200993.1 outer membrane autotransporter protein [Glaciimonas immobilis]